MNSTDLPLPLLVFYGVVGVFVLATFVSACWLAATTRSRGWRS